MVKSNLVFAMVSVLASLMASTVYSQDVRELSSYVLLSDSFASHDVDVPNKVYYTYDQETLNTKLTEYQVRIDGYSFPQGSLFIVAVTDHVGERFTSLSIVPDKRQVIINLRRDAATTRPGATTRPAALTGKKRTRILVIACPPLPGVRSFAVKTADGKYHDIGASELSNKN